MGHPVPARYISRAIYFRFTIAVKTFKITWGTPCRCPTIWGTSWNFSSLYHYIIRKCVLKSWTFSDARQSLSREIYFSNIIHIERAQWGPMGPKWVKKHLLGHISSFYYCNLDKKKLGASMGHSEHILLLVQKKNQIKMTFLQTAARKWCLAWELQMASHGIGFLNWLS
jgi:hypothetical protein